MLIPNFPSYDYTKGTVTHVKTGKVVTVNPRNQLKLKDAEGKWKAIALTRIQNLCGDVMEIPKDAVPIPNCENYFIDEAGTVYGFGKTYPQGKVLTHNIGTKGYPIVQVPYKGKLRPVAVHQLMCVAFILEDYVERGLVCLHADDDKTNCRLDNLSVGTYSQNNKDAYARGLNSGNIDGVNGR